VNLHRRPANASPPSLTSQSNPFCEAHHQNSMTQKNSIGAGISVDLGLFNRKKVRAKSQIFIRFHPFLYLFYLTDIFVSGTHNEEGFKKR
jgi:hypothetical protein